MRKIKFVIGGIYHIFNRGVEKRDIFLSDRDRWRFLQGMYLFNDEDSSASMLWRLEHEKGALNFTVLKKFVEHKSKPRKPLVKITADCFMPNHFHFIMEEIVENGISRFMHKLGTGYTMYFNKKYKRVGSLFQGTFKALRAEEDIYLQYLLVYVNVLNPGQLIEPNLKEQGVKNADAVMKFADDYLWSTHKEYLGTRKSVVIEKGIFENLFPDSVSYRKFVKDVLLGKKSIVSSRLSLPD